MYWQVINRENTDAKALADVHYNRKNPDSPLWLPPCTEYVALLGKDKQSLWACCYQRFRRDGFDCFDNTYFRYGEADAPEGVRASDRIREATSITLERVISKPRDGIITFIDPRSVRPTIIRSVPTWGYTYIKAGYTFYGVTKSGKLIYQYCPAFSIAV